MAGKYSCRRKFTMSGIPETEARIGHHDETSSGSGRALLLYVPIALATAFGIAASIIIGRTSVILAGLGIVAYVLGLRHGVDADHIAAIDNTIRKLMQEGKNTVAVGTWFSLGHSTVVVTLIVALIFFTRTVTGGIPALQANGAVIGTAISGTFLWIIGLMNVAIALGIYRIYRNLRAGDREKFDIEDLLSKRGFLNRYFYPLFRVVNKQWQIYPIGILFGLGFDTASEVALIAISVGADVSGAVPLWMILVLPFMFTCGMVLVDTTDGIAMRKAYGWAFQRPIRKIYYNLTLTVISVMVALAIGSVEVLQVFSMELRPSGAFWTWVLGLNFSEIGYFIVAIFTLTWLFSMAYYKYMKIEELIPEPGEKEDGPLD